jgi:hypothetical protein
MTKENAYRRCNECIGTDAPVKRVALRSARNAERRERLKFDNYPLKNVKTMALSIENMRLALEYCLSEMRGDPFRIARAGAESVSRWALESGKWVSQDSTPLSASRMQFPWPA